MASLALRPVQIAYHVPDPADAAERLAREHGWGPFYLLEHIPLARSLYRGAPAVFDHSSAYGQAGDLMIELITQHNEGPSALRDLYAPHESGIHHVACFVPDLASALIAFRQRGVSIALDARTATGVDFAMLDVVEERGHMLELYEPGSDLIRFYGFVRRAAQDWDGSRPFRVLRHTRSAAS
jgi:catechol 2,3-dioxygenase-like lactoylglutathione lyase family enzyme